MNDNTRMLLRFVCEGDMKKSKAQAKIVLNSIESAKDEKFKEQMLRKLESKTDFIELPYNLKELLIAEDVSNFPEQRFLLREDDAAFVQKLINARKAAQKLDEIGISYLPSLILYGESGTGKTMLAKYAAHKLDLPFVYVRFSSVVSSYLGSTQSNISKIFDFARSEPCVLCLDEIDSIGMARGQKNDVGEMNRIVIALMQELDRLANNVVVIGTTNRFDRLDPALVRRFSIIHQVLPLSSDDAIRLAEKFFAYSGVTKKWPGWLSEWFNSELDDDGISAASVINKCTEKLVEITLKEAEKE